MSHCQPKHWWKIEWSFVEFLGWPNRRSTNCIQESSQEVTTFKSVLVKAAPSYKDENTLAFYSNGLALRRELKNVE